MSVLAPVAELKRACQAEAPNQVDVLMMLYKLRLTDLNNENSIRHYLSNDKNPRWIEPNELTPLAKFTRLLLRDAFDERFFSRYYYASKMAKTSYVFEMQQKLQPIFKSQNLNLNAVILLVCKQQGFGAREACDKRDKVHELIRDQLRTLLNTVADPSDAVEPPPRSPAPYYSELEAMFAPPPRRPAVVTVNRMQRRVDEELDRWKDDPMEVERSESGKPESVLSFWQRVEHHNAYIFLPRAVKVIFAIPASSCQIERDFSVSGSIVTSQRTSLSQHTIDMATFLNRNDDFYLLQCEPIKSGKHRDHTPSCFTYPLDLNWDMEDFSDEILAGFMSGTSFRLNDEEKENS